MAKKMKIKRQIKKIPSALVSLLLCAAMLLQAPGVALAFIKEAKWDFLMLRTAATGETLSESYPLESEESLNRAYNPYTERAELLFTIEYGQPMAIELWTVATGTSLYTATDPRGEFVGYLRGSRNGIEWIFDDSAATEFIGYRGRLAELGGGDPNPPVNETNFINTIAWDGVAINGGVEVQLEDGREYLITLQPLTASQEDERAFLRVTVDRWLPPDGLGMPYGAGSPFSALSSLPGRHDINMITGNYHHSNVDLAISGVHILSITRTYNSMDDYSGIFGANWRSNHDYSLDETRLGVTVTMPDGAMHEFAELHSGGYSAPIGSSLKLEKTASGYAMTDRAMTRYEFDSGGRIVRIATLGGFATTYSYGADGLETINGRSGSITLSYSGGRVTSATSSEGRSVAYAYDSRGDLVSFTNPQGQQWSYGYDGGHRLTEMTDGNGRRLVSLAYDWSGRASSIYIGGAVSPCTISYELETRTTTATDATGRDTIYRYNRDRLVVSIQKPAGVYSYEYENGRLSKETSPEGHVTSYGYDSGGNMNATIRNDGSGSRIEYNAQNLPTRVETLAAGGAVVGWTSYEYDARGNVTRAVDRNGNATNYVYNADNNPVTMTRGGETTTYDYDGAGRLTDITTPDGETISRSYNAQGKLERSETAMGFATLYEYNGNGFMTAMIDPLGYRTEYEVDANGRVTARVDALGNRTEWEYDAAGNTLTETDPLGNVRSYEYDPDGRLKSETDPDSGRISYFHDDDGRLSSMTDARGYSWSYGYDSEGRQTGLTDPLGHSLSASHDDLGRLLSSTNARGAATTFEYNADGYIEKTIDPLGYTRSFVYDGKGNITSATDENGNTWTYSYDEKDRLEESVDPYGNKTKYEYDSRGRLVLTRSPLGIEIEYRYDADGRLRESIDGEGNSTVYEYDAMARLTNVLYADGSTVEYEYDALGRLTKYTDAGGAETNYGYDAASRMTSFTDALGGLTEYRYDGRGNITHIIDALGGITEYRYDTGGKLTEITNALGETSYVEHDELGRLKTSTDMNGGVTSFEYDAVSNVKKRTNPDGGETSFEYDINDRVVSRNDGYGEITIGYDNAGNPTSTVDPLGNVTSVEYDEMNRIKKISTPDGGQIEYAYDDDGRLDSLTRNASGGASAVTSYHYDRNGRLLRVEDALGNSRSFAYDSVGRLISETDENGMERKYAYDLVGNLTRYTDPMGSISEYGYDALGRLIFETLPRGNTGAAASRTEYRYDALGRVTSATDPLGRETTFTYDALGRIKTVTDALGNSTGYEYDGNGNVVKTTDTLGNVSTFEYDAMDRLVRADTPDGLVTIYHYDTRGLVTHIVDPGRGELLSVYDAAGNLIQETDGNGNVTLYEHDPMGRVSAINYSDGRTAAFAYDPMGNLVELNDWTGTTSIERDLLGQISKVTDPNGNSVGYTWDGAGNRASITAPDGTRTDYTYNGRDQMTSASTNGESATYSYYATGRLRSVELPTGELTTYAYDLAGNLVSAVDSIGGNTVRSHAYKYDELGRLTSETMDGIGPGGSVGKQESHEYGYDAMSNLSIYRSAGGEYVSYSYDSMGNLLREVSNINGIAEYSYNDRGQLFSRSSQEGIRSYSYDPAGNLVAEYLNGALDRSLQYDSTGRFVFGENAKGETSEYSYNGLGHRIGSSVTRENPNYIHQMGAFSRGTEHIGDIGEIIASWSNPLGWTWFDEMGAARQDETITETKSHTLDFTSGGLRDIMVETEGIYRQTFVWGIGLVSVETTATGERSIQSVIATVRNSKAYAHQNRLGGISYFTDASGKTLTYNEHDAWGNAYTSQPEGINHSGLNLLTGFTGYTWDAVLEVHFAQARLYDPIAKRFMQTDPIGGRVRSPMSINPYLYCRNDPVNYIDPTGMAMPDDYLLFLTAEEVAQIEQYSIAWFAAEGQTNQDDLQAAAHKAAEAIRDVARYRQENIYGHIVEWTQEDQEVYDWLMRNDLVDDANAFFQTVKTAEYNYNLSLENINYITLSYEHFQAASMRSIYYTSGYESDMDYMHGESELVLLASHTAFGVGGQLANANHSTVVMMVDSSSEFWDTREFTRNDPLFGGTVQYATIGGEGRVRLSHETQQIMTEYNGEAVMYFSYGPEYYLIGDTNRASDTKIANKKEGQMVSASSEQIRSMLESNSNYALNAERDVPYTLLNPGLNSNSYARGILDSAEVAYNDPVGRHPNWEHPVPNQYFVD